jgi:hypothetical protein
MASSRRNSYKLLEYYNGEPYTGLSVYGIRGDIYGKRNTGEKEEYRGGFSIRAAVRPPYNIYPYRRIMGVT